MIDKSVLKNKTQNVGALGACVSGGFLRQLLFPLFFIFFSLFLKFSCINSKITKKKQQVGAAMSVIIGVKTSKTPQSVFYVDIALLVVELVIVIFVVRESKMPAEETHTVPWYKSNPFSTLRWLFTVDFLPPFIFMIFFANLAHDVLVSNFVLWAHYRFGWTNEQVGITLLIYGGVTAVTQSVLVRIVIPWFGEKLMLIVGLAVGGLVYLGFGLTPTQ